jgi:isocitrate dehydrogenase
MSHPTRITVAYGDGIGPQIMEACLQILQNAGAKLEIDVIEVGENLYSKGYSSGISPKSWEVVKANKILFKAPITTPQGKGVKSLNVTLRKSLGLFANIRPVQSYFPFVNSKSEKMDLVIVRENEEDLYAGIEYKFSYNFNVAYKVITRVGCEKIIRYAFEYARQNNRKRVTALVKDNIMKITDGSFHEIFKEIATLYPEITADSMIVDIGSARIAARPDDFDVIVTENLYGDIVSDIAAEVSGSVGLAGSANIGRDFAMFEAIHGSAPDIAGKNIANPSGLLNGAIMMLNHIGQGDIAAKVKNAWLKTIEDGIHTADIYKEGKSQQLVSTDEFAKAVIKNLGSDPSHFAKAKNSGNKPIELTLGSKSEKAKQLIGCDLYIEANSQMVSKIAAVLDGIDDGAKLHLISQRGLKVWPNPENGDEIGDILRCRFIGYADTGLSQADIIRIMSKITDENLEITNSVMLYTYDKQVGFSMAQGE